MKHTFLYVGVAILISAVTSLPALALDEHADLLGDATQPSAASRAITIDPGTTYVNVTRGEIVKFVVGDKTFAWNFDGPSTIAEIDLNKIAPPGVLDHIVKAYIRPDPMLDGY